MTGVRVGPASGERMTLPDYGADRSRWMGGRDR